ncbi:hypothetical protein Dxin01_00824 [Deinococcus xinjiangensis]|uniref:Uncharacterized protein n=1 Tax=Deinococcus xinjiangensis TaxID=457454 RepID=A0ABP9VAQ4_9DEIO
MNLSPTAQTYLDQANALFPGRYTMSYQGQFFIGLDGFRNRNVAVEADDAAAARKTLTSARLSKNNGQRRYEEQDGRRPQTRFLKLPQHQWWALEALAAQRQVTLEQLLLSLLPAP